MIVVTGRSIALAAGLNVGENRINLPTEIILLAGFSRSRSHWQDGDSLEMDVSALRQTDRCCRPEYPVFENCIDARHLGTFSCEVVWTVLSRILAGTEDALIREEP